MAHNKLNAAKLKKYKPITPSLRGLVTVDRSGLWKGRSLKSLTQSFGSTGGRNSYGRITVRHKGGGHKRLYRMVDFKRLKHNIPAFVERLEYDPNRSAFIALVKYEDGEYSYILAPEGLKVGDKIVTGKVTDVKPGNAMQMNNIPIGTVIHNIEMKAGKGGQLARAAGCYAQLIGKDAGYALVRLKSGEVRMVRSECYATIGAISNADHQNRKIGKAGRNRWLGIRPTVRGVAMNPVDHPHGGGEGKTSGGRHPVSPWGQPTKGKRTRQKKKTTGRFIVKRRYE